MISKRAISLMRDSFPHYCDWTLRWLFHGQHRLLDDGRARFAEALNDFANYKSLLVLMPRGVGKSTIFQFFVPWLWDKMPWLQVVYISATAGVAEDAHNLIWYCLQNHPMLEHIRPVRGEDEKEIRGFDIPGKVGKGMSFRGKTMKSSLTGLRGHIIVLDDLETAETVSSDTMRRKMRWVAGEAHNLLYNEEHTWAFDIGTPWDVDSYHSQFLADRTVRIPAWTDQGAMPKYNFVGLDKAVLDRKRKELANDVMFEAQYQLRFREDMSAQPVTSDMLRYEEFDADDLHSRLVFYDPAGGAKSEGDRKAIIRGERRGDAKCLLAAGVREDELCILDIFARPCGTKELLKMLVSYVQAYSPYDVFVESNMGAWVDMLRTHLSSAGVGVRVEGRWSHQNKLKGILSTVVPLAQGRRLVLHSKLRHRLDIRDQLFGLRYHSLPKPNDDIIDTMRMTIAELSQWLFPKVEKRAEAEDKRSWFEKRDVERAKAKAVMASVFSPFGDDYGF